MSPIPGRGRIPDPCARGAGRFSEHIPHLNLVPAWALSTSSVGCVLRQLLLKATLLLTRCWEILIPACSLLLPTNIPGQTQRRLLVLPHKNLPTLKISLFYTWMQRICIIIQNLRDPETDAAIPHPMGQHSTCRLNTSGGVHWVSFCYLGLFNSCLLVCFLLQPFHYDQNLLVMR